MSDPLPETRPAVWLLLSLLIALFTCAVGDAIWLQHENTLYHNGRWISTKVGLSRYTMGALSFVVSQTGLAYNRLNLGVWHGDQEVLYRDPLLLDGAEFDCDLPAQTYVSFILDKQPDAFKGVRLSVHPDYPSVYFESTPEGRFTRQDVLPVSPRKGWNHVRVVLRDGLWITVNGTPLPVVPCTVSSPGLCGFRGCLGLSAVDNVVLRPRSGPEIQESFDDYAELPKLLACTFLAVAAGMCLLSALLWLRNPRTGPFMLTLNLWLLMVASLGFGAEWFYFGPRHPKSIDFSRFPEYRDYVEAAPGALAVTNEIQARYGGSPHGRRIIFVGSSQTWGSGASLADQTWVCNVERRLNREHSSQGPFECINAGVSGLNSAALELLYLRGLPPWIDLKPELCVIDLSFNDGSPVELVSHVTNMIRANQQRHIRTLIVLEPANTEYLDPGVPQRREALAALADKEHVPCVRMQEFLNQHQRDGFIWWDMIHLTSFGQQLFADRLYPDVVHVLLGSDSPGG